MSVFYGYRGMLVAPTGVTNFASEPIQQVGSTDEYVITDLSTRMTRSFLLSATESDFTPSSGTITGITPEVASVNITGATAPVTLSSTNLVVATMQVIGGFHDWELTIEENLVDTTTFSGGGRVYRQFTPVVTGWSAVARRFWVDERFTVDVASTMQEIGDAPFVVHFILSNAALEGYRYSGFCTIEDVSIDEMVGGVTSEVVRFRGYGTIRFRTKDN